MGTPLLDDQAIEDFFLGTGQSAWAQDHALLTLVDEVLVATGGPPPRPEGALLVFLDDAVRAAPAIPALVGVSTLPSTPTTPWQPRAAVIPSALPDRHPNRHFLARRLRLTASIAAGIGIAAATLTAAGTTGVLPDPATRAIAWVVEAVSPFELSEPGKPLPSTVPPQLDTTSTIPATADAGSGAVRESGPSAQPPVVTPPGGPPASAPTGQGPVQPGNTGLDRAGQTPAGPFIPPFVSGGTPSPPSGDGSSPPDTGVDRARETPAGTFIPPFAGGPPGRG